MPISEFDERSFESLFERELRHDRLVLSPGTAPSGIFGFDASWWICDPLFWRRLDLPLPPTYPRMPTRRDANAWGAELDQMIDAAPPMRTSLVLKYKRPVHLGSSRAREWNAWQRPYLRYSVAPELITCLGDLSGRMGDEIYGAFVAPAYWQTIDLRAAAAVQRMLKLSNVAHVSVLVNDTGGEAESFTYTDPGYSGVLSPGMVPVHSPPMTLPAVDAIRDGLNTDFLVRAAQAVEATAEESSGGLRGSVQSTAGRLLSTIDGLGPASRGARAIATLASFAMIMGVSWHILFGPLDTQ